MIFTCEEMSVGIIASGSRIDTIVLATSRAYNDNIITKDEFLSCFTSCIVLTVLYFLTPLLSLCYVDFSLRLVVWHLSRIVLQPR